MTRFCVGRRVADLVDPYYVKSATALRELQSLPLSSYGNDWFIYIACSRWVSPRRLN